MDHPWRIVPPSLLITTPVYAKPPYRGFRRVVTKGRSYITINDDLLILFDIVTQT